MKISFVTPAYNAETTICRCLDSLLSQTDGEWEAIIVDDGSKDKTYEIACAYAERDSRIKALTQENQGPGITRNNAMRYAKGEYIAFLDSDDYIEPNYVALVKNKILSENLDVLILDNYYEEADGKLIRMEILSQYEGLDKDKLIAVQMTGKMPWGGCRKVIKADIIKTNKIEYLHNAVGEESLFSFQVFLYAKKIGFLGKPVLHYVNYPSSQSKKGDDDPWGDVVEQLKKYLIENGLYEKYEKQLNSFAATALIVSLYRVSIQNSFGKAIKICKSKCCKYFQKYSLKVDSSCLETRAKFIFIFVKINFIMPIVMIAKTKQLLEKFKK